MTDAQDWKEVNPAKSFQNDDSEAQESQKEIPEDLKNSFKSIQLLVNVHDLLLDGRYGYHQLKVLDQSLKFIEQIHKNALEAALKHPDAHLIPQLTEAKQKLGL